MLAWGLSDLHPLFPVFFVEGQNPVNHGDLHVFWKVSFIVKVVWVTGRVAYVLWLNCAFSFNVLILLSVSPLATSLPPPAAQKLHHGGKVSDPACVTKVFFPMATYSST